MNTYTRNNKRWPKTNNQATNQTIVQLNAPNRQLINGSIAEIKVENYDKPHEFQRYLTVDRLIDCLVYLIDCFYGECATSTTCCISCSLCLNSFAFRFLLCFRLRCNRARSLSISCGVANRPGKDLRLAISASIR